jgi:pimeloyl-ACP methyl ester carboxylesterase
LNLFHRTVGNGEPLLILHGLFGSSDNWMTLGSVFSKHFQVILVDLRNHGQSPHSEQWDYQSMAEDIYNLCKKLGLKKINLLGHSMGGKVGMTLAGKYRELLIKLVVADIAPKHYPIRHRQIIDGLLSINISEIKSRTDADVQLSNYVTDYGTRMFLLKNLEKNPHGGFKWRLNLGAISEHLENVGVATIPENKIEVPTLFVRGVNSDYVTDEDIMEIRKYYTQSTVETIGNAGHWIHAEQPEAFAKTVLDFLKD